MKHNDNSIVVFTASEQTTIDDYIEIVEKLVYFTNDTNNHQKEINKIYNSLAILFGTFISTKYLDIRTLLNYPLEGEKRLIHHVVRLSQYKQLDLYYFFELLIKKLLPDDLNIQDANGNTPLLEGFTENPNNKKIEILNFESIKLLLYQRANPIISNNQGISAGTMIKRYAKQDNLNDTEQMDAQELLNYCLKREEKRF
jgi:ankyrin repeat protein